LTQAALTSIELQCMGGGGRSTSSLFAHRKHWRRTSLEVLGWSEIVLSQQVTMQPVKYKIQSYECELFMSRITKEPTLLLSSHLLLDWLHTISHTPHLLKSTLCHFEITLFNSIQFTFSVFHNTQLYRKMHESPLQFRVICYQRSCNLEMYIGS